MYCHGEKRVICTTALSTAAAAQINTKLIQSWYLEIIMAALCQIFSVKHSLSKILCQIFSVKHFLPNILLLIFSAWYSLPNIFFQIFLCQRFSGGFQIAMFQQWAHTLGLAQRKKSLAEIIVYLYLFATNTDINVYLYLFSKNTDVNLYLY